MSNKQYKKYATILLLLCTAFHLAGQAVEPIQVEWNGQLYWKYLSVDQDNNTPYKFNYQYDSTGRYIGWIYEFPKDGAWISFFKEDSTKVASIFHVQDSLIHGKSTQFRLTGQIQSEYEFYKNVEVGFVRYWYENGIMSLEHQYEYKDYDHYQSRIRVGEWKSWDSDGNIMSFNQYQNNNLHGRQLEFYENGQIKVEGFYIDGVIDSTFTEFHSNGQIFKQLEYKSGKFIEDNPSHEYHPTGQISGQGNIILGMKEGFWQYFHENGNIESEGRYGEYVYEHEHGDLFYCHKQGTWKYWFPNGNLKAIGSYSDDLIRSMPLYEDYHIYPGENVGDWRFFNEHGVEITIEEFTELGLEINHR